MPDNDALSAAGVTHSCPLKPLYHHVVIIQDSPDEQTKQGVIVAESAKKPKNTGTIIAVGEGRLCLQLAGTTEPGYTQATVVQCHVEPLRVKPGDRVMFSLFAGNEVEYDLPGSDTKQKVLIMSEDEIVAVLPPSR